MISENFLTGETRDCVIQTCLAYSYDTWLVLLLCLVAMFASYTVWREVWGDHSLADPISQVGVIPS